MNIPPRFIRKITATWPDDGPGWLERLPELLRSSADRWRLTLGEPVPNLSFNYVVPAEREDGTRAIIKAGVPNRETRRETEALRCYGGQGCVLLLDADEEQGLMLLESLEPGVPLTTLASEQNDERATSIAASVMRKLWRSVPAQHSFPTVQSWSEELGNLRAHYGGGVGPFPTCLVEAAQRLFSELLSSAGENVLLHGDLHHDNILSAQRDPWLAIDPKGVVGEPAYEIGRLVQNLWPNHHAISNPKRLMERRLLQLAEELGLDRERVHGYCVAESVLSAWWCVEDNSDSLDSAIATAEMLRQIRV